MNITGLLQCLNASGINTGTLFSYYDFNVKDSALVFNQKFSSGSNYYQGLINYDAAPGIIVGISSTVGSQKSTLIKNLNAFSSFSCLFDFDFSGCQNTGLTESTVLLTSKTSPNQVSGISLGIDSSNRLFVENNRQVYTLDKELKDKNLISFNISSGRLGNFGVLDFDANSYYSKNFLIPNYTGVNDFYLINFLSGANAKASGAMGTLQNFALFSENISDVYRVLNCALCSGIATIPNQTTLITSKLTGLLTGGLYSNQITGYSLASGVYVNELNQTGYYYYLSGVIGPVLYDYEYTSQFETGLLVVNYGYNSTPLFNSSEIFSYNRFNLFLNQPSNGDNLEIYSYLSHQPYQNLTLTSLLLNPPVGYYANLYINGVLESEGFDYQTGEGGLVTILREDIDLSDSSFVVFYEPSPTYTKIYSGQSVYTITGLTPNTYEIFINGLKGVKNSGYTLDTSNPNSYAVTLNTGILNIVSGDEIKVYPSFKENAYYFTGTSTWKSTLSGQSGVSELFWQNGQLLQKNVDYVKYQNCFFDSDYFLSSQSSFLVYNNDNYYLNI